VPRLPFASFPTIQYGNGTTTPGNVLPAEEASTIADWSGSWYAADAADHHGMLVLVDPANPGTASLQTAMDADSSSNSSSVVYAPPGGQAWTGDVSYVFHLCFYDENSWPSVDRGTTLPKGCGPMVDPVNNFTVTPRIRATGAVGLEVAWAQQDADVDGALVCTQNSWTQFTRPDCAKNYDVASPATAVSFIPYDDQYLNTVAVFAYRVVGDQRIYSSPVNLQLDRPDMWIAQSGPAIAGEPFQLKLHVMLSDVLPGVPVELWRRTAVAGTTYKKVGTYVTNDNGVAKATQAPLRNTYFQWRYAGLVNSRQATVVTRRVVVAYNVSIALTKPKLDVNERTKVWGVVKPGASGKYVTLRFRDKHYVWRTVGSVPLKKQLLPDGTKRLGYVFRIYSDTAGDFPMFVKTSESTTNGAGESKKLTMVVR
jgi:hypothetical protein